MTATPGAERIVEQVKAARQGQLTITIGTGCCESTAPFLYEDFWPGSDQAVVGEVAAVPVYAPGYLRASYPGDDGFVVDVVEGSGAESMSIETEFDARLILRGLSADADDDTDAAGRFAGVCNLDDGAIVRPSRIGPVGDRQDDQPDDQPDDGQDDRQDGIGQRTPVTPADSIATGGRSRVVGEMPDELRRVRLR